ncbi:hypothetical protein Thiowin_02870 [Thiorhodovibrio winogradskyi]|uniref:Uncharacterized protein n=1 Tax=Thiorhodovibrio winogradskyi TaxID=77007 RepID=A0ABZ0S9X3_9GAMM|nr:hypothetical protein [Thiorhodovibrio winogradskyi]
MNSDEDMDERTTADLLEALDSDYQRCYQQIITRLDEGERDEKGNISADYEFEARQLIRAAFAYIEGAVFVIKIEASFNCEEKGIELTPQQHHFIFEADFDLNDKGEVVQKPAKIPLAKNIRFAFSVFAQANGIKPTLDVGSEWWSKLQESIRVRDRLTHPRSPSDLDVSPSEVISTVVAKSGFDEALHALISASKA